MKRSLTDISEEVSSISVSDENQLQEASLISVCEDDNEICETTDIDVSKAQMSVATETTAIRTDKLSHNVLHKIQLIRKIKEFYFEILKARMKSGIVLKLDFLRSIRNHKSNSGFITAFGSKVQEWLFMQGFRWK